MRKFAAIAFLTLTCCSAEPPSFDGELPSLATQFKCLPKETAIISAHRGTSKGTPYPENSIRGLKHLIGKNYLMAEIDVAALKDRTHILFHDGVWDDKSTGFGPVVTTTWKYASEFLLKDTQGRLTSETPPKLEDYLRVAKGKIYLEIDFKTSANYERVIELVRKYKMSDQVILISYNSGQARKLAKLAPEMMISLSVKKSSQADGFKKGQVAAWVGDAIKDSLLIRKLEQKNIPVLGKVNYEWSAQKAKAADILVTDYALEHRPITGLTTSNRKTYEDCLTVNLD